jgi:hypothetical protein
MTVMTLASTLADVASKEVFQNLSISLTVGTRFICLAFSNSATGLIVPDLYLQSASPSLR